MILLRHGAPLNTQRCYGHSDPPLRETPYRTASRLKPVMPRHERLVSSPSRRCRELAEALMGDKQLILAEKLKELNFGDWENRPWSEVPRGELDAWARMPLDFTLPGGESPRELQRRVNSWARDFAPRPGDLIIAHAGSLRALAAFLLNTEFETTWQWPLPYATPVRVIDIHSGFIPETAPSEAD